MNLASLVPTLVLVASTATAGLFSVPGALPTPTGVSDGPIPFFGNGTWDNLTQWLPCPIGACQDHNGTGDGDEGSHPGNATHPPTPWGGNSTDDSPPENPTSEPTGNGTAPPSQPSKDGTGCDLDMNDSQQVNGQTRAVWTWQVSERTQKLEVRLSADAWLTSPFSSGVHLRLTDGNGSTVASADRGSGASAPISSVYLEFKGEKGHDALASGTWTLTLDADAIQGSAYMGVESHC